MSYNRRNALNASFAMTILAISEKQGVKNSIFDKNNFIPTVYFTELEPLLNSIGTNWERFQRMS